MYAKTSLSTKSHDIVGSTYLHFLAFIYIV